MQAVSEESDQDLRPRIDAQPLPSKRQTRAVPQQSLRRQLTQQAAAVIVEVLPPAGEALRDRFPLAAYLPSGRPR
jgi:hypothetical protein